MSEFNAQSTADDVIAGISLVGRVAVVTGASAGLGVETARVLAGAGATVVLLARDAAKLAPVLEQLAAALPQAQLDSAIVDLADLDSVRGCAAELLERYPRIHLLINNAGVMACPQLRTAQGFEMQFGTNHLGHFLLTGLLLPALLAAAEEGGGESRVVSLSSSGHKLAAADLQDPNFERTDYDKFIAYGQSKSANSLFAVGLDRRFKDRSVRAFAVHPGMIMTDLGRHMSQADVEELMAIAPPGETLVVKSVEQGAATSVWAASSPDLAGQGGIYLENCQVAKPAGPGGDGGFMPHAADPEAAESLWELSEELVGQKF
jgi:NAD(P)-dependent dehydrogenase (short-subunit alcohol dehydrogenase family)